MINKRLIYLPFILGQSLTALAEAFEGQVTFATLDVETQPQTPSRYGIGTLPALLFFKHGQVVDELIGVEDKADIAAKLHALLQSRQT